MDKALVFGTKDCRFESYRGQLAVFVLRFFMEVLGFAADLQS